MDARFSIECQVNRPDGGFRWVNARLPNGWCGPFLIPADRDAEGSTWGAPQIESALFRIFAALPLETGAALDFANRHGRLLGLDHLATVDMNGTERVAYGDPWFEWVRAVVSMRYFLTLSDLASDGDAKGITQLVESLPSDDGGDPLSERGVLADNWLRIPSLDLLSLAPRNRISMAQSVATPTISGNVARLKMGMVHDHATQRSRLIIHTGGLLGVLWMQFATSISESKQYRKCQTCGKPFELTPDLNRTSRFYCKTACRLRAFRERKREAVRLKGRGRTLKQIAESLESDVPTIRGWLKEGKK